MSALTRPATLAGLFVATAALVHPALRSESWLPGRAVVLAALVLLLVVGLVARAFAIPRRWSGVLIAAGAALLVGALAGDGLRGHRGLLDLTSGQARTHFDEVSPEGRSLGLRPLGFSLGLEGRRPDGGVILTTSGGAREVLTADSAVGFGGFRFGRPRVVPTGDAASLRVSVSGGGIDRIAEVRPGRSTQVGDLSLVLEEYFPDFALDEQRQPFTRSAEPRNPGAILVAGSGEKTYRVFVLRAMPGVHRVEEIDRSFSLLAVEPEVSVEMDVRREPLALGALLGGLLVLAGVALGSRTP